MSVHDPYSTVAPSVTAVPFAPEAHLLPGTVLAGRYRIDRFLGQGAMGTVYQATHLQLDHPLAIKTRHQPHGSLDAASRERFRHEAKIAISMDHSNLVRVFDYGTEDLDYLVMELVEGTTLQRLIRDGGILAIGTALRIAENVLDGLGCLHAQGIVHRDVKPANILVRSQDTRVKLSDFGLALDLQAIRSRAQTISGTPAYMPPEVITGKAPHPASDIFSLGVTLFEMLTGHLPWQGASLHELWQNITSLSPRSPLEFREDLSPTLAEFVLQCLSHDPASRFAQGEEAAQALRQLWQQEQAEKQTDRLFRNRFALLVSEASFATMLSAALGASGLLAPVLSVQSPEDARLNSCLNQLDAILMDLEVASAAVMEQFIGRVRNSHPEIVFFLLFPSSRAKAILGRFSPAWQQRLEHYFTVDTSQPFSKLPEIVEDIAGMIVFDQQWGRSKKP